MRNINEIFENAARRFNSSPVIIYMVNQGGEIQIRLASRGLAARGLYQSILFAGSASEAINFLQNINPQSI